MDNIVDNADESSAPTLPEELILKILEYVEVPDLKTHLLIKEHRDVIQETSKLMRKLPLILKQKTWKEKMPFIKKNGSLIKGIRFENCRFYALTNLGIILTMCKNVESVSFIDCYIIDENLNSEWDTEYHPEVGFGPLKLTNLKSLWLNDAGLYEEWLHDKSIVKGILNYLENVNYLERLSLTFHIPEHLEILKKFLLQQKKLKHLELYGYRNFDLFFKTNIAEQIHFQLDRLTIHFDHYSDNENSNNNFVAFFRTQKSIKDFYLGGNRISCLFHQNIIRELKQMKNVKIVFEWNGIIVLNCSFAD